MSLVEQYCDHCGPSAERELLIPQRLAPREGYDYYRCVGCDVRYYSPRDDGAYLAPGPRGDPDPYELAYRTGNRDGRENLAMLRKIYGSWIARIEQMRGGARGRLLDAGCFVGHCLSVATEMGWDAVGVEPDTRAVEYARLQGDVHHGTIQSYDGGMPFDAIIWNDVVEHTYTPWQDLLALRRMAAPGCILYLKTFCEDLPGSEMYVGIGHAWHLPRATLTAWVREAGWDIEVLSISETWAQMTIFARAV